MSEIDNRYRLLSEASWRSFDHHGKRNSKYIKKEFRKNEKVELVRISLIDLIVMKTLLTARLPVTVSSVQT